MCVRSASFLARKNQQMSYLGSIHQSVANEATDVYGSIRQWPTRLLIFAKVCSLINRPELHAPAIGTVEFCSSMMLFAFRHLPFHPLWSGFGLRHPQGIDSFNMLKFQLKERIYSQRCVCVCTTHQSVKGFVGKRLCEKNLHAV